MAGEPVSDGFGACSYNIACGTDLQFGRTCGGDLGTFDPTWINGDGVAAGDPSGATPPGCPYAMSQEGFGASWYFFGGHSSNPLSSLWLTPKVSVPDLARRLVDSCGNQGPLQASTTGAGTYDRNAGETWTLALSGVPAGPARASSCTRRAARSPARSSPRSGARA